MAARMPVWQAPLRCILAAAHDGPMTAAALTGRAVRCRRRVMLIYKIFRRTEWDAFRATGHSAGAPVDRADGFIHLSTAAQVAETAARHFADESDLVLVAVAAEALGDALKWEPSRGGQLFPHLYRDLRLSDVVWDKSLPLGATGHIFPEGVW
jgi:uncharacterized protein (DUF952 family)